MIPIAKPWFDSEDEAAVAEAVRSGWVLQGPKVEVFEKLLGTYMGSKYAVATSSCTTALHIAYLILGLKKHDEVIVPSFSFIASANSVVHAGGKPVFADIDRETYNINPLDLEQKITRRTRAILAVHQIGLPADMQAIMNIARKYHLVVVEDAACGLGARIGKKYVGTFGDMGAFSFHPRKAITTAEGGLLVTKTKRWADTARILRAHGASISVKERHTSKKIMNESYPLIGYNFRMSDIHAALGISQFRKLEKSLAARSEIAKRYSEAFKDHSEITIPLVPAGMTHSFQSYIIRIKGNKSRRDRLMQKLLDDGIATRRGVMASHLEKPYRKMYPKLRLAETERAAAQTICLPLFPQLSENDQEYVIDRLKKSLALL